MVNGIINVYKEKGFTSFDVVAKMREFNDEYARCYGMKDGKLYVFADR